MTPKSRNQTTLVAALALPVLLLLTVNGCKRDKEYIAGLPPAQATADPVVFDDAFGTDVDYSAFEGSDYEALSTENSGGYENSPTLKVTLPSGGPENTGWAGGSFWTHVARDLSSFNALTFQAKASQSLDLSECGIGIPIVVDGLYQTTVSGIALDTSFDEVVIPIPDPSRLTIEQGMFWFSHASDNAEIWFDEVIFKQVENITNPRPVMKTETIEALLGEVVTISDTKTTYNVNGEDLEVGHSAAYYNYFSTDEAVISTESGVPIAVGGGTATVTAKLIDTDVDGTVTVTVIAPPPTAAPVPTHPEGDVVSLFSDAYTVNTNVTTWRTDWSSASTAVYDQQIEGDNVKAYTGLNGNAYVGIDFSADQIDATTPGMTHFHMNVFAPAGSMLAVKLVDFGPDGGYGGGDDTEKSLIFHGGSTPPLVTGEWLSLDIPLTDFTGMNFGNVAQMVLQSTDIGNVWIDNLYFHK